MSKLTFNQKRSLEHNFYQNGLYQPTRTIVLGTNPMKSSDEASEFTDVDFIDFIKNLHILEYERTENEEDNLIKILLNSTGGDIYLGFAIYDAIRACESTVEIRVIGRCMSMATVILQAADHRYAYPNASFMVHNASYDPGQLALDEAAVELNEVERIVKRMMTIYENSLKISRNAIEEMLKQDTYIDAYKAKKIGLIDAVKERFDL